MKSLIVNRLEQLAGLLGSKYFTFVISLLYIYIYIYIYWLIQTYGQGVLHSISVRTNVCGNTSTHLLGIPTNSME